MAAIAAEAGVAERTVYAAFGAKREILSAICDVWLEEANARELVAAAAAETDASATVDRRVLPQVPLRVRLRRHGPLRRGLGRGPGDPRDAAGQARGTQPRQNLILDSIRDALVIPLGATQAIYRALAAVGVYQELVVESG